MNRAYKDHGKDLDVLDKNNLIQILHEEFNLRGETDQYFVTHRGTPRYPDVMVIQHNPQIAFELDGESHGESPIDSPALTSDEYYQRGLDYSAAEIELIVIPKAGTNGYQRELVIEYVGDELKRRKLR